MAKASKNAPKQAYPVTVVDGSGNQIPPGTPVVIDAESSARILATFGNWTGAEKSAPHSNAVKIVDLEAPQVLAAIAAAAETATTQALAKAREAFEEFLTLPESADAAGIDEAMANLAAALGVDSAQPED